MHGWLKWTKWMKWMKWQEIVRGWGRCCCACSRKKKVRQPQAIYLPVILDAPTLDTLDTFAARHEPETAATAVSGLVNRRGRDWRELSFQ